MKYLKLFMIGLFFMGLVCACKNDQEAGPQPEGATITLTSPGEGDMFLANATVPIVGTITAPTEMHGYEITLRNKTDNIVLFTTSGHAHGTAVTLNEKWTNTVSSDTEVELEVAAILDHDNNKTVKKVIIHCHH